MPFDFGSGMPLPLQTVYNHRPTYNGALQNFSINAPHSPSAQTPRLCQSYEYQGCTYQTSINVPQASSSNHIRGGDAGLGYQSQTWPDARLRTPEQVHYKWEKATRDDDNNGGNQRGHDNARDRPRHASPHPVRPEHLPT